jgi:hypothetical protein
MKKEATQKKSFKIVLSILGLTLIISLSFFLGGKILSKNIEFKNQYPLIDPARRLVEQKHFFSTIEPLRTELKSIVQKYENEGSEIGLYLNS